MTKLRVPGIPAELETAWGEAWEVTAEGLAARAGAETDLFTDPSGGKRVRNAPRLTFGVEGDFLLDAEVEVEFASTFDAGVLVLWQDEDHWAKLCFEYSPQGQPMVVSVVNREWSDDCNSVEIGGRRVRLRVARRGMAGVLHYSEDGEYWHLVRVFRLGEGAVQAGFLVQSPKGAGCRVEFGAIRFRAERLGDYRSGE